MVKGLHCERYELICHSSKLCSSKLFTMILLYIKKSQIDLNCLPILLVDVDLGYSKHTHELVVMFIMKPTLINIVAIVDCY